MSLYGKSDEKNRVTIPNNIQLMFDFKYFQFSWHPEGILIKQVDKSVIPEDQLKELDKLKDSS